MGQAKQSRTKFSLLSQKLFFTFPFFLLSLISPQAVLSERDNTTVAFSQGKDITEAVIRKLIRSQLFPEDFSFMLRLANVESRFGTNSITFRQGNSGGIWQVDEDKLRITQDLNGENGTKLLALHEGIRTSFNISWASVSQDDLVKPVYSGLAARLFFMLAPEPIPDTIKRQAHHWAMYYRQNGDEPTFNQDSKILQDESVGCSAKFDICIALDGSTSISTENFSSAKDFIISLISSFDNVAVRFAMFAYSNKAYPVFDFGNKLSLGGMVGLVQNAVFPYGDTFSDLALTHGVSLLQKAVVEYRGVPQVILVLTDGQFSNPINESANLVIENNVTTVVINVQGPSLDAINETELLQMALGKKRNLFQVSSFGSLSDFLLRLSMHLCGMPQQPLFIGEVYIDVLGAYESRYYILEIPSEEGITVRIKVRYGQVQAFWAYDEELPFASVHDGIIDGVTFIPANKKGCDWFEDDDSNGNNTFADSSRKCEFPQMVYMTVLDQDEFSVYEVVTEEGDHDDDGSSRDDSESVASRPTGCCFHFYFTGIYIVMFWTTFANLSIMSMSYA